VSRDDKRLRRLRSFEGLCLTVDDIADEQRYHRDNLHRHNLFLHGHGLVQGLQVRLEPAAEGRWQAIIQAGFGITALGQQVYLPQAAAVTLPVPKRDGFYMLWLFHVETDDPASLRPSFGDGPEEAARVIESCAVRLHPLDEAQADAVALTQIRYRGRRMGQVPRPVPRAGRLPGADSQEKPHVLQFVRTCRQIIQQLMRSQQLRELELPTLSFNNALIAAASLLIEDGTSDRVLYRTAGLLVGYAHDFFIALPRTITLPETFLENLQTVNAQIPAVGHGTEIWAAWFVRVKEFLADLDGVLDRLQT